MPTQDWSTSVEKTIDELKIFLENSKSRNCPNCSNQKYQLEITLETLINSLNSRGWVIETHIFLEKLTSLEWNSCEEAGSILSKLRKLYPVKM